MSEPMHRGVMFQYFEWNCKSDGSLWRELAGRAPELRMLGVTAVWMPPAAKAFDGGSDTGYAVYDLYDLGEFDQKNSVRTKYGTKDEYLAAVKAVRAANMHAYADIVLNHRMGGDEPEEVEIVEIDVNDRTRAVSAPYIIKAWAHYTFAGRGERYSSFKWHARHFNAFGRNADAPNDSGKIYKVTGKDFSGEVANEFGNFDYLMGADVDTYHPEVREEMNRWAQWFVETTQIDGFRLDAVKHIPSSFYRDWLKATRDHFADRELFAVGEYWSPSVEELQGYLAATEGAMRLFDTPLHFRFLEASQKGKDFDLSKIFDGSLVQADPLVAVTFVDNHDSQPGQSLESWVLDWFKPFAYALILLRQDGYPCLFYGDYYGNDDPNHKLISHRKLIDDFLKARGRYTFGDQHDYFDHPTCIAWVWSGDDEHPGAMAVVMSTADAGVKHMNTFRPNATFYDITGHIEGKITTNGNGEADFTCPAGSLSVWCTE
ncbi:MAG TPA: alpha-amylase [Tepidisphaeraceae bacterium]|jgi:alpha-amylase